MSFADLKKSIAVCGVLLIVALFCIAIPVGGCYVSAARTQATSEAKQVGFAILLYAEDHNGVMPLELTDLVPKYLPDAKFFRYTRLTTPGAALKALPKDSIIAFRLVPKENTGVVVITNDGSNGFQYLR